MLNFEYLMSYLTTFMIFQLPDGQFNAWCNVAKFQIYVSNLMDVVLKKNLSETLTQSACVPTPKFSKEDFELL